MQGAPRGNAHLHVQVDSIDFTADSCLLTASNATFEYDLTLYGPPAHDHEVDQLAVVPLRLLKVVHWEPELAALAPQLLW